MCSSTPQTVMQAREREGLQVPSGSKERGERTMVVQAYLGGLAVSAVAGGKVKRSLVNGARFMDCQKSDYPILAKKSVKADGAKGIANQQSPEAKHAEYRRLISAWKRN